MATVKELKATARPKSGKGAARAERRAGRVPGVIYGNNQPPVTISVDDADLRQRILAGRFLTTIYDIDLEGRKHRVIPRDFHLDPVKDFPIHVDFMRLGEGATIRISVPLHVERADASPGVKRGGTVNIVTHAIELECSVDNIPQFVDADVSGLEIGYSLHLSDIKLPAGVKSLMREDATLVTIVPPSGYAEEQKAAAAAAAAAALAGAVAAPGAAAPAAGAATRRNSPALHFASSPPCGGLANVGFQRGIGSEVLLTDSRRK
jgi:large subunit ribosomal protein L25